MLFVIVLYILVTLVSVGSVPVSQLVDAKDYALAALLARSSLGSAAVLVVMVALAFGIEAVFRRFTGKEQQA